MVSNEAEKNILGILVNTYSQSSLYLKLYRNNAVVAETTALADLTQITEGSGSYAPIICTPGNWTFDTSSDITTVSHAQVTWTFTGSIGNVYGYYLVTTNPERLVMFNSFPTGPYNITNNGEQIKLTIRMTLD